MSKLERLNFSGKLDKLHEIACRRKEVQANDVINRAVSEEEAFLGLCFLMNDEELREVEVLVTK